MVYHPMYNCRREYETLLYLLWLCSLSHEAEHNQRRYNNDYFGEKKHDIEDYKPSKHWYGLTSTYWYSDFTPVVIN